MSPTEHEGTSRVLMPSYWRFHGRPLRIVRTKDGGTTVELFDREEQVWQRRMTYLAAILGGDPDADELTREDFERWTALLQTGSSEDEAWEEVLAHSASLVEGRVEAIKSGEIMVRGQWWQVQGGLAPTVRSGDWVQLRRGVEETVITEIRPIERHHHLPD